MLDQDFCTFLEFEICKALNNLNNDQVKGFWCDGVLLPLNEREYSKLVVNSREYIVLTAFSGKSGQDQYELKLEFGKKSLSRYSRDLDIREYLNMDTNIWFDIDIELQKMKIRFD